MSEVNKEKLKALQMAMDKLEKTYGKGAVMKLGDDAIEQMEVLADFLKAESLKFMVLNLLVKLPLLRT